MLMLNVSYAGCTKYPEYIMLHYWLPIFIFIRYLDFMENIKTKYGHNTAK